MSAFVEIQHNRVNLALHRLRDAVDPAGHDLLLVHGLGEATPSEAPGWSEAWPGTVWGLDLTGHGRSDQAPGGGYTAEVLMADVAIAVTHLDRPTVVGRGLGAYLALLTAGALGTGIRGAVLVDGPGLAGGGPAPGSPVVLAEVSLPAGPPDPYALIEMSRDVRPPDYALSWVHQAVESSGSDAPITVVARVRPPWLAAVAEAPGVDDTDLVTALERYSR